MLNMVVGSTGRSLDAAACTSGGAKLYQWSTNNCGKLLKAGRDYVVLQDQSQVPSFIPARTTSDQFTRSRDQAVVLAQAISESGAETRLLNTWGRRDGDSSNPWLQPDFSTMQNNLNTGYQLYRDAIAAAGLTVDILPVGSAWAEVHMVSGGAEVHATDAVTPFKQLYSRDGSHAATNGNYLSSLVIFAHLYGVSPHEVPHKATCSFTACCLLLAACCVLRAACCVLRAA
jgi:hypothetical protein